MQKVMKLPIRAAPYRHQVEAIDFVLKRLAHVIPQPLNYQDSVLISSDQMVINCETPRGTKGGN